MKRLPPQATYAVSERVLELTRRFQYPDIDTIGPTAQPSGGGGAPTVVVAASDASDLSKSKADYVCSGVSDNDIIQDAINSIALSGQSGRVLLTEGTFNFVWPPIAAWCIDEGGGSGLHLQGMSERATVINVTGTPGVGDSVISLRQPGSRVSDLRIEDDGTGTAQRAAIIMGNSYQSVENVNGYISGSSSFFLWSTSNVQSIRWVAIDDAASGIFVQGATYINITDCVIFSSDVGISLEGDNDQFVVAGNYINAPSFGIYAQDVTDGAITDNIIDAATGINLIDSNHVAVTGNVIDGAGYLISISSSGAPMGPVTVTGNICQGGIELEDIREFNISGNEFANSSANGISVVDCEDGVISGNQVHDAPNHGIYVDATDVVVTGNHIDWSGSQTTNTYDNIHVTGDRNVVMANLLVPRDTGNTTRYGINIAAGDDNAVYANYLGDSSVYGTADSIDSGTATQLTPAAGAIGGQFAY